MAEIYHWITQKEEFSGEYYGNRAKKGGLFTLRGSVTHTKKRDNSFRIVCNQTLVRAETQDMTLVVVKKKGLFLQE